jgi:XTP/dITP diphosphohydrolase
MSARYGSMDGEKPSSDLLIKRVLDKMVNVSKRQAYFKAVIVLFLGNDDHVIVEGECYGEIADNPIGSGGFGYDPIFWLPQYKKTMAELLPEEKNAISHRGIALSKLKDRLSSLLLS